MKQFLVKFTFQKDSGYGRSYRTKRKIKLVYAESFEHACSKIREHVGDNGDVYAFKNLTIE